MVEAFEEISNAKGLGIIGNHYSSFAEGSASAVVISSSSEMFSDGNSISDNLTVMVLCIYMCNQS